MALFLSTRSQDTWTVVEVHGRLDTTTAQELHDCLGTVTTGARSPVRLILDLSPLAYCDASGLGVLVGARNNVLGHGGELRLVCPPGHVHHALESSRLSRVLSVYRTLDAACAERRHTAAHEAKGVA